jgi:HTH-type transcriptional regulator/antitoxin HigA
MTTELDNFSTPGQLVEQALEAREWTKKTLSLVIGVDEAALSRVLSAKRPLTAELALAIEEVLEVSAEDLLELQKKFDLAQARLAATPDPGRKSRVKLFGDLKVNHLIRRGWLDVNDDKNLTDIEHAVLKFFGRPVSEIEQFAHAAKKTDATSDATLSQIAWMYRVRQLARQMHVPAYSREQLEIATKLLKTKLADPQQIEEVPAVLATAGVRLVVVESLPAAKIDGVCLWLDDSQPVIGLSARFDRIDNFWFVLRHEIEHVLNEDGKGHPVGVLDTDLVGKRAGEDQGLPPCEVQANHAAANFCVDSRAMDEFFEEHNPYFSERKLLEFASALQVHPGIVAGQLQKRTERYDRFRGHLAKVRAHLVMSAVTDGWGNIPHLS